MPLDQQTIQPGYYPDLTNEEYHSGPGVSKSHLDIVATSPRHYWAKYIDQNREQVEKTPALILGSAIDFAVLEPDNFTAAYCARPEGVDGRTKEGKAVLASLAAEHAGKTILKADDYAMVMRVRDAVHAHPVAAKLFRGGKTQQTFYAIDPETGELVKCRFDCLHDSGLAVDLKSTADASQDAFSKSINTYRYHVQDAWYRDTTYAAVGLVIKHFVFVAVEKEWPHAIGVWFLDNDDVEIGRRLARMNLETIARCRAAGEWPDYATGGPRPISLPPWARKEAGL